MGLQLLMTLGLQELARAEYGDYCEAATAASFEAAGLIQCPSCGITVERLPCQGQHVHI